MGQILTAFPELPSHRQTVVLALGQWVFLFTWRARTGSWYFDLWTVDGQAVILGRRLSVSWLPLVGLALDLAPDGFLYVRGPDNYQRGDLGTDLLLIRYDLDELPPAPPEQDAPTVVFA